jgi:hypothetical protein
MEWIALYLYIVGGVSALSIIDDMPKHWLAAAIALLLWPLAVPALIAYALISERWRLGAWADDVDTSKR